MTYPVAEAGIAEVFIAAENEPLAPIVAVVTTLLIVMERVSPLGGNNVPAASVPDNVMEGVPKVIDCEAGTVNNGVILVIVSVCVAAAVPAEAVTTGDPAAVSL